MHDVFLSYAAEDRERARQFAAWLEAQGWSVWWDQTIPPGRKWDETIESELGAARCAIVLWSHDSARSDWVKNEAAEAVRRKILVPVRIDPVDIPLEFRRIQTLDLLGWDGQAETPALGLLRQAVAERTERPGQPPALPVQLRRRKLVFAALAAAVLVLVGWFVVDQSREHQRVALAPQLAARSEALRRELVKKGDESTLLWPFMLAEDGGARMAEQAALLALESVRRVESEAGTTALRRALALLPKPVREFAHDEPITAIALNPETTQLATASRDGTAAVWNIATGQRLFTLKHESAVRHLAFAPDGRTLATAGDDKAVRIWEAASGRALTVMPHADAAGWVAFSPDGRRLATLADKSAHLWSLPAGSLLRKLDLDRRPTRALFSADGRYLVTAGAGTVDQRPATVWNPNSGEILARLAAGDDPVEGIAIDRSLLAVGQSERVTLWRLGDWTRWGSIEVRGGAANPAFGAGGVIAVGTSATRWGALSVNPVAPGDATARVIARRRNSGVYAVGFSADGRSLYAIAQDQTVQAFDTASGEELLRAATSEQTHNARAPAAFTADGRYLVAIAGTVVRLWEVRPADLAAAVCERVTRNLSDEEWRRLVGKDSRPMTCPQRP